MLRTNITISVLVAGLIIFCWSYFALAGMAGRRAQAAARQAQQSCVSVDAALLADIKRMACERCVDKLWPSECTSYCAGVTMHSFMVMSDVPAYESWPQRCKK